MPINNPPSKTSLGLENVDNTSDANKPISTATQTALDAKQATLVSTTNIKTINGRSVLGSGDLTVGSSINVFAAVSYNSYTNTINRSYNVSSVVDNGTGRFTVNFTTPASSVYYYMSATTLRTANYPIGVSYASSDRNIPPEVKTTSSCKISMSSVNSSDLYLDAYIVDVVFFY